MNINKKVFSISLAIIVLIMGYQCYKILELKGDIELSKSQHSEYKIDKENELVELRNEVELLKDNNDLAGNQCKELGEEVKSLKESIKEIQIFRAGDEEELSKLGLNKDMVAKDLVEHPELIPFEGVLGGTMSFSKVYLINYKYAFARFDDGHIVGYGLYEYSIDDDKGISWKLIKGELYK